MAWQIHHPHTRANFTARHMMIANVHGQFDKVTGTVDFNETAPELSTVDVQIDAASIDTHDADRDGHLKSPDFLDIANHPTITFKSKRAQKTSENTGKLVGDLTIRGVTKEVTLDVEYNGQAKDPWGPMRAGFTAATKINRKDWGLNWNVALETGGWLVSDDVKINLEIEIVKQPETQPAMAA